MTSRRSYLPRSAALLAAFGVALSAFAQDDGSEQAKAQQRAIDEIVVVAPKDGDPVDVEARDIELLKQRIAREYAEMQRIEERDEWRRLDVDINNRSRIKWGYNPQDEYRLRRDTELTDLPFENVKPATVFRVEF